MINGYGLSTVCVRLYEIKLEEKKNSTFLVSKYVICKFEIYYVSF